MKPTIDTSPLLQRIAQAIERHQPRQGLLRVSIARDAKWETSPSSSEQVLVRWLCWSLQDGDDELVPPEFEVLHPDVTEERLREALPDIFPSVKVVVDDDIDV
ncbi:MAG: hypothetical protein D6790_20885 [Caldilineae bacterium]|nr:MAG: hypothetical protein D6790_20885 [Caldilineae bacterium]